MLKTDASNDVLRKIDFWVALICIFGFGGNLFSQNGAVPDIAIGSLFYTTTPTWNDHDADTLAQLVDDNVIYEGSDGKILKASKPIALFTSKCLEMRLSKILSHPTL